MPQNIEKFRTRIDQLDSKIVYLLIQRFLVNAQMGSYKKQNKLPIVAPEREQEILTNLKNNCPLPSLHGPIEEVYRAIFKASHALQE